MNTVKRMMSYDIDELLHKTHNHAILEGHDVIGFVDESCLKINTCICIYIYDIVLHVIVIYFDHGHRSNELNDILELYKHEAVVEQAKFVYASYGMKSVLSNNIQHKLIDNIFKYLKYYIDNEKLNRFSDYPIKVLVANVEKWINR